MGWVLTDPISKWGSVMKVLKLALAKWVAPDVWLDGYTTAFKRIRECRNDKAKYAYLGENGERVVVDAKRLRELEELEVMAKQEVLSE